MRRTVLTLTGVAVCATTLAADRLYMRNGREVEGRLVSVRGSVIEFEEAAPWGGRARVNTFDRRDVRAIEIDDSTAPPPGSSWGSGGSGGYGGYDTGSRPPGMREREVVVNADNAWTDTGIDVRSGQSVYFRAQGRIVWGKNRRDGPEGEKNSPNNPGRPIPSRAGGSLIGRIGGNDVFFVGAESAPFRMRSSGRLYLGINDDVLNDNSGNFRVMVSY